MRSCDIRAGEGIKESKEYKGRKESAAHLRIKFKRNTIVGVVWIVEGDVVSEDRRFRYLGVVVLALKR